MATINANIRWADNTAELKQNIAQGIGVIDAMKASVDRTVASLSGNGLFQAANKVSAAIIEMGGATKLTAAEQDRANAILDRALEKYRAMGMTAPPAMQEIRDSMKGASDATSGWLDGLTALGHSWVARVAEGILLRDAIREVLGVIKDGVMAFPDLVAHTIEVGNSLYEMSLKTGGSVENLSALRFVASQTGMEFSSFGNILFKMEQALGAQGAKADELQKHLDVLHLSLKTLKDEKPDQAFIDIMSALEQIPNRADQAAAGMALFGKGFKEMAGLTQESITELMEKAKDLGLVMSTEQAAAAHAAEVGWKAFTMQLEAAEMAIGAKVLPALVTLEQLASEAFKAFMDGSKDLTHAFDQSTIDERIIAIGEAIIADTAAMAGFVQGAIQGLSLVSHEALLIVGEFANVAAALIKLTSLGTANENSKAFFGGPSASAQALKGLHDIYDATALVDKGLQDGAKNASSVFAGIEHMADGMAGKFREAFEKARATIDDFAAKSHDAFGGVGDDVEGAVKKTGGSIKALSEYWDDYNTAVAGASGDAYDKQIAEADKWRDKTISDLDKVSGKDMDYVEKLGVVWATYYAKLEAIDLAATEQRIENSRAVGLAAETLIDKEMKGQSTLKLMAETMGDINLPAKTFIDHLVTVADRTKDATLRMNTLHQAMQALTLTHIESALADVGSMLNGINAQWAQMTALVARTADTIIKDLAKGDWIGAITAGISSLIGVFANIGGPSKMELEGRKLEDSFQSQFKSFSDMAEKIGEAYRTIGKSNEDAQADIKKLIDAEKQGGAAVQAVIDKIKESMDAAKHQADLLSEASSLYGPSHDDLLKAADHAKELFDTMLKAGTYTQEQLNNAYMAWQKAMAAAGDAAAAAWVKAHDAATAATAASTTEMSKAETELKGLIDKRNSLAQGLAQEAPEQVMGVIETQQRSQLKVLDDQIQQKADAYAKLADETGQKMADAIVEALKNIHIEPIHVGAVVDMPNLPDVHVPPGYNPNSGFNPGDINAASGARILPFGGVQYFDRGTWPWVPRGSDVVPAMLTPNEQVLSVSDARAFDRAGGINALRNGRLGQANAATGPITVNLMFPDKKIFATATIDGIEEGGKVYGRASRVLTQMVRSAA